MLKIVFRIHHIFIFILYMFHLYEVHYFTGFRPCNICILTKGLLHVLTTLKHKKFYTSGILLVHGY